jgi:hypothetical protein
MCFGGINVFSLGVRTCGSESGVAEDRLIFTVDTFIALNGCGSGVEMQRLLHAASCVNCTAYAVRFYTNRK